MSQFNFELAGVKFRREAYLSAKVANNDVLTLKPEPTNKYDPNAVQVFKGEIHIGYVPREFSSMVADHLAQGNTFEAKVMTVHAHVPACIVDVTAKWKE